MMKKILKSKLHIVKFSLKKLIKSSSIQIIKIDCTRFRLTLNKRIIIVTLMKVICNAL